MRTKLELVFLKNWVVLGCNSSNLPDSCKACMDVIACQSLYLGSAPQGAECEKALQTPKVKDIAAVSPETHLVVYYSRAGSNQLHSQKCAFQPVLDVGGTDLRFVDRPGHQRDLSETRAATVLPVRVSSIVRL